MLCDCSHFVWCLCHAELSSCHQYKWNSHHIVTMNCTGCSTTALTSYIGNTWLFWSHSHKGNSLMAYHFEWAEIKGSSFQPSQAPMQALHPTLYWRLPCRQMETGCNLQQSSQMQHHWLITLLQTAVCNIIDNIIDAVKSTIIIICQSVWYYKIRKVLLTL